MLELLDLLGKETQPSDARINISNQTLHEPTKRPPSLTNFIHPRRTLEAAVSSSSDAAAAPYPWPWSPPRPQLSGVCACHPFPLPCLLHVCIHLVPGAIDVAAATRRQDELLD